jgi:hypothetical protein
VGVGTTTPTVNTIFDSSGNSLFSNIQERISTLTTISTNNFTANYANGSIFTVPAVTANYALNLTYLPSLVDTTKTFSICLLTANTLNSNYIATSLTVANIAQGNVTGSSVTLLYNGGNSSVQNATNTKITIQQILLLYINTTLYALTNVSQFQ